MSNSPQAPVERNSEIKRDQFTTDWVGKTSYWMFRHRRVLLIVLILITVASKRWRASCGCRRRSRR